MKKYLPILLLSLIFATIARGDDDEKDDPLWKPQPPIRVERGETSRAAMKEHLDTLKKKLPNEDFSVVDVRPFFVIGDDKSDEVKRRAEDNVRWAMKLLKKSYFAKDPPIIIDVWLFKDKESYETNAKELFGKKPETPFGYYSSEHRALVMNISTGGGTLIHELVHPYMATNFPDCPSWFNEGLASLYEQCGEKNGEIYGYTNWRLPGLQRAIRKERLPSFETLCSTTTEEFYSQDKGTNYAQARYLCYYLQEENLLKAFYKKFRANCVKDPTGYKTLQEVLAKKGDSEMKEFQKDWEAWALTLEFKQ